MVENGSAEPVDRAARRRTRLLLVLPLVFLLWQVTFYQWGMADAAPVRSVDQVKLAAWAVWAAVLLIVLATGGGLLRGAAVRRELNDEVAVAHRREGQRFGFWAAVAACFAVYAVNLFEPVGTRDAIHLVLSLAVASGLLRYAMLERRAERAG